MRKIVVSEFITLDGVIEDPGWSEKFEYGGWTWPYWNEVLEKFKFDELFSSDALLLWRITYEGFASAWPTMKDEEWFADRMNSMAKYVVSGTLRNPEWNNTRAISGDLRKEIQKVKDDPGMDILVHGSAKLTQSLMEYGLVDELRLLVFPVVLWKWKRLFDSTKRASLKLVESRKFDSGVVLLRYALDKTEEKAA